MSEIDLNGYQTTTIDPNFDARKAQEWFVIYIDPPCTINMTKHKGKMSNFCKSLKYL